jgi:hypothetical protein
MNFEQFQEKAINGELANVFVTYTAYPSSIFGDELEPVTVTGERDELVDFDSAVSDEACLPIAETLEEYLTEQYDMPIEVNHIEVKHIIVRVDSEDESTRYIAFTPEGGTLLLDISAEENFQNFLASLLNV